MKTPICERCGAPATAIEGPPKTRDELIERTKAGLARARAQGKRLGRPPVDPDRLAVGATLIERQGYSVSKAARAAGVSRTTLRHHLADLAKKGEAAAGPKVAP